MPEVHALLSASGAHRWLNCTPSAILEAAQPDSSSEAAREGTAAHALAEWKLLRHLKHKTGRRPKSAYDCAGMEDYTDAYVDFVKAAAKKLSKTAKPFIGVEQRLDFSDIVPDGFGTGDCVIISEPIMHIVDLKYGQGVQVFADGNPQMRLYALGALATFAPLYDIDRVRMTIFQPRLDHVDTAEITVKELNDWAENVVRPKAKMAAAGEGEFQAGEWCRFCRIRATCRARAEKNLAIAQAEFAKPPAQLAPDELAKALEAIPDLKKWASDVETYALQTALDGAKYEGFKLVEGRSVRKFSDEALVAEKATKAGYTDIYTKKLLGITALEKRMGKKTFQEILGGLVEKPAGKPALVPISDKRPPLHIATADEEFEKIEK